MGHDQSKAGGGAAGGGHGSSAADGGGGGSASGSGNSGDPIEARINKSLVSFKQLSADVRHVNSQLAKYFVRPQTGDTLYFQIFTKLKSDNMGTSVVRTELCVVWSLAHFLLFCCWCGVGVVLCCLVPLFWKLKDNVVVAVQAQPPANAKPAAAAASAAASTTTTAAPSSGGGDSKTSSDSKTEKSSDEKQQLSLSPKQHSVSPKSKAAAAADSKSTPSNTITITGGSDSSYKPRALNLREFYALFLFMCDNVSILQRAAIANE